MTKEEKLFALLRRWTAINKVMETLSEMKRTAVKNLFEGKSVKNTAKELKVTQARVKQIEINALKILADMLFEEMTVDAQ